MLNSKQALIVTQPIDHKKVAKLQSHMGEMGLIKPELIASVDDFLMLGAFVHLRKRSQGWQWLDWLACASRRLGDEFYGVVELFGEYDPQYIRDMINLHYRFPLAARKWKLTYTHYREVMTLPEEAQATLLTLAEQKRWGASKTLRAEVRKLRAELNATESNAEGSNSSDSDIDHPDTHDQSSIGNTAKISVEFEGNMEQVRNRLAYYARQSEDLPMGQYRLVIQLEKIEETVIEGKRS